MIDPETERSAVAHDGMTPIGMDTSILPAWASESVDDQVSVKQLGQFALIWLRFRRHRVALFGSVIFFFMCFLAVFGPWISPTGPA